MYKKLENIAKDETKELPVTDTATGKIFYNQKDCKTKKYSKEYFLCKERSKVHTCARVVTLNQINYCLKPGK